MADADGGGQDLREQVDRLERQLRHEQATRRQVVDLAAKLNSTLNLDELLQLIMSSAADLLAAETSSLMLLDEDTGELIIEVATGATEAAVVQRRIPAGAGIAGWVLEQRQPAVVDDPASDTRFYQEVSESAGFVTRDILAVPMLVKDRAIGVVEVINKHADEGFTEADVELATALANLAAIALDNARMYAQLADAVVAARMSYRL
jgi:sigma-B regulation protein RsbU (phosphoserine phosphatase)